MADTFSKPSNGEQKLNWIEGAQLGDCKLLYGCGIEWPNA